MGISIAVDIAEDGPGRVIDPGGDGQLDFSVSEDSGHIVTVGL